MRTSSDWEYLQILGEQKICLAQKIVFTKADHVVARMAQESSNLGIVDSEPWIELP